MCSATRAKSATPNRSPLVLGPMSAASRARSAASADPARPASAAERALLAADIDPSTRGERLGVADFARVAEHIDWANAGPRLR